MKKGQAVGVDDIPSKFLMDRGGGGGWGDLEGLT